MNCTYTDDSFCLNTHIFYFLNGSHNNKSLNLHGKLKYNEEYHLCSIILTPIIKTLFVKAKHGNLIQEQEIENALRPFTKNMTTYESEIVQKQTICKDNNQVESFLKIQYSLPEIFSFDNSKIPDDSCIEYIYGLNDDVLEQFLLQKNIKGPCWLQIEVFSNNVMPSCPSEINCHPDNISLLESTLKNEEIPTVPPLRVVFLDVLNKPTTNARVEPMALTVSKAVWYDNTYNTLSTKIFTADKTLMEENEKNQECLEICNHSRGLLKKLHETLEENTDIIICPNKAQFIYHSNLYYLSFKDILEKYPLIDLTHFAREFYPDVLPNMENLLKHFLNVPLPAPSMGLERITQFIRLSIEMDVVSTFLFISNITGCQLIDVPSCGLLKRVEYLLKHELHKLPVVLPEKHDSTRPVKHVIYGGEILEPNVGYFKDMVVAYDFKSLYPSVIREYNICFFDGEKTMLPRLMDQLLSLRETMAIKENIDNGIDNTEKTGNSSTKSNFLKILANSIVGCLSSEHSIFYQPRLANLITNHARLLLTKIADEVSFKLESTVIYGHTDSVFAEIFGTTNYDEVLQRARAYQEEVNRRYKYVRLKLEGVFSHAIVFGKQQYALRYHNYYPAEARSLLGNKEVEAGEEWAVRGVFRKTTPKICHNLFKYFLERIVVKQPRYARTDDFIKYTNEQFRSDSIEDYVINVQLKQSPTKYKTDTAYGNIVKRNELRSCFAYYQYAFVSYVICDDGTDNNSSKRAYDLNEVRSLKLSVDKSYYKKKHVFGLVEKIYSAAPQYVNLVTIQSFLKPKHVSLFDLQIPLPKPYEDIQILAFHFQCLKCWKYVILNTELSYKCFISCCECKARFAWPAQADEILSRVEDSVADGNRKLSNMRRLVKVKGVEEELLEKVKGKLVHLEVQYYRQLALWREVIVVARLGLEGLAEGDLMVSDTIEMDLKKLFDRLLGVIDAGMEKIALPKIEKYGINLGDIFQICET